jgi:hypothetical protein
MAVPVSVKLVPVVHIMPVEDKPHAECSHCWCGPEEKIVNGTKLVTHKTLVVENHLVGPHGPN